MRIINNIQYQKMHRITTKLVLKLSTTSIRIPELESANKLCLSGKYKSAESQLLRTVEITKCAGLDGSMDGDGNLHVEAVAKYGVC